MDLRLNELKRLLWNKPKGKNFPYPVEININNNINGKFLINSPMESYRIEKFGDEFEFTQRILDQIQQDDVFFDIGACLGLVTTFSGKLCKE